ncbi:formate/nitrite transporter family protein [Amycolatopsis sp. FU40]|uniref:formate/nitrite transporter family protein n=1 Tax=Amycolatopsis sp. FU40 TaxID=2914159 RepID=UPI001F3D8994|nr:formate/nitrite transporter family protein [Amycolatopsis sp. FU40]UKD55976.1 formate/nitrite transporter family protein [Amycolatopsis sp. FU40]
MSGALVRRRAAPGPGAARLASPVEAKTAESASALFFRGVLCNFLSCLAVRMAARTKSDGADRLLPARVRQLSAGLGNLTRARPRRQHPKRLAPRPGQVTR